MRYYLAVIEPFLHEVPYHLHRGITFLQMASWIAIATAGTVLVLSWGRILAWLREDQVSPAPRLIRWGVDDGGWYAEVRHLPEGNGWMAELECGDLLQPEVTRSGRSSWLRIAGDEGPRRLIGDSGEEIAVPAGGRGFR